MATRLPRSRAGSVAGWPSPGLPRLDEQAGAWDEQLHKDAVEVTLALSRYAVDEAVATARELGHLQPDLVIHGDLHATNILRAEREPWLTVDPRGYAGDPAYDSGMPVKWRPLRLLEPAELRTAVRRALDIFAAAAELDRERVGAGPSAMPSGPAATDHRWTGSPSSPGTWGNCSLKRRADQAVHAGQAARTRARQQCCHGPSATWP
jgi:hypothetical protein